MCLQSGVGYPTGVQRREFSEKGLSFPLQMPGDSGSTIGMWGWSRELLADSIGCKSGYKVIFILQASPCPITRMPEGFFSGETKRKTFISSYLLYLVCLTRLSPMDSLGGTFLQRKFGVLLHKKVEIGMGSGQKTPICHWGGGGGWYLS